MLYISPPFGNYINLQNTKSIHGTFTWERRKGIIHHTLRSLRPVWGGWRNQIGLRNWGIRNVDFSSEHVYSISAIHAEDWELMLTYLPSHLSIELNLGCPNVTHKPIPNELLSEFLHKFHPQYLQVKVSPEISLSELENLFEIGIQKIHLSNTLGNDPRGGISGKPLRLKNLRLVKKVRKMSDIRIIAGGGIYSSDHLKQYHEAGATDFSLATVFLSCPWNVPPIIREYTNRGYSLS